MVRVGYAPNGFEPTLTPHSVYARDVIEVRQVQELSDFSDEIQAMEA